MIEERRFARSSAMRLLYSWSMGDEEQLMTLKMLYEDGNMTLDAGQQRYIDRVIDGVKANLAEIDRDIDTLAEGWSAERLPKVDLAILRLGIFELGWCDEIPAGATINECVELAKEYSVPQSGAYINGILSSYERNRQNGADESKQTEQQ